MKTLSIVLVLFAAAPTAMAEEVQAPAYKYKPLTFTQLAQETGLSTLEVRTIMCPGSPKDENLLSYKKRLRRLQERLGQKRFEDLVAGRPIELQAQGNRNLAGPDAPAGTAVNIP